MDALAAVQSGHRGLGDLGVCLSSPGAVDSSSVNAGGFHGTLCADSNNDYSQVYEQSLDILVARNKQAAETGRRELLRTCEFSLQELLGGWMCLRLVLRGYLELDVRDPVALCAVCKAIAPPGGLLKCSRCKIAVYCCKQHQREDWSIHKVRY